MTLSAEVDGPDGGRRLVLVHGFTQNAACWGGFARRLADHHRVVRIDAPGHGRSDPEHDRADLWQAADLVGEAGQRAVYVGYSMGGRLALHLALARPELVDGLVLIGATAGIDDPTERADRRAADEELADRIITDGLDRFLDGWLAAPLFAGLSPEAAARPARLTNRPEGLAASLRHCGTGTQDPLWDRLGALAMPVVVVTGEDDEKFTAIGHRLVERMTSTAAELVSLPGTHAVHLEHPELTADVVLDRITPWPPTP